MDIQWIYHNDKKILLIDYRGIVLEKDMIKQQEKIPSFLSHLPANEPLLALANLTGCYVTPGFLEEAKKMSKEVLDFYSGKRAVLGITGGKVVLLKGYNLLSKHKLIPFNSELDALAYLTS